MKLLKWLFGASVPALNIVAVSANISCEVCGLDDAISVRLLNEEDRVEKALCKKCIRGKCTHGSLIEIL